VAQAGTPSFPIFFHVLHAIERLYEKASRQAPRALYPSAEFAWTRELEEHWPEILGELEVVLKDQRLIPPFHEISPEQRAITEDEKWRTYVLHAYGARANHNCRACPRTAAAVERIPGMKTAFFSILAAGKHIPAHRGPYKGLLRCHLGLVIPAPASSCRIRVGNEIAHWQPGRALIFDDTVQHEVWNDSVEDRVVLFIDFSRPMSAPMSWLNEMVMRLIRRSPYGRSMVKRFRRWHEERGIVADVTL
jgi:aspartyl/asparaginyl beta-hydroxylase (cupin superfamily)